MSIEAIKAIQMVYANTTKHDWPDDIWDAICKAIEAEKQEQDSTCNETLRAQGKAYPRTCKKCGFGPCVGKPKAEAEKQAWLDERVNKEKNT